MTIENNGAPKKDIFSAEAVFQHIKGGGGITPIENEPSADSVDSVFGGLGKSRAERVKDLNPITPMEGEDDIIEGTATEVK
jgi:hypothetical protein